MLLNNSGQQIKVYVFTDNRSVVALSLNGKVSNGASGAGFARSSDNSHGPRGPELLYIPGVVGRDSQPAVSNAHKTPRPYWYFILES